MKIGCVVKAAGKSTRFAGGNKLLADLCGKPVLSHVLDALPRECFARLVVVVSSAETNTLCRAHGVETFIYPGGPVSETVRLGLKAIAGENLQDCAQAILDGCLFAAGDQPLLTRASCLRLINAFEAKPDFIHRLSFKGIPGAPVIFPKRLFSKLAGLTGERGGMSVMKDEKVQLVSADRPEELQDADTKEALDSLRRCYISAQKPE